MSDSNKFKKSLDELQIHLDENQFRQFQKYYDLLIEWNKVMNLTAITEYEEVIEKHFIDSLSLIRICQLNKSLKVIDIGTGAGFPGIPLKIAFPQLEIVLLDSLNKRVKFLNEVIQTLELEHIETVHSRAEDFGSNKLYREKFDLCVSRAVANLASLSEYCLPSVKVNGFFIPYKSGKIQEEVANSENAIKKLGGKISKIETFHLPYSDIERSFVQIQKIKNTPKEYPRSAGKPTKDPIN
jgi:16S rRNA (guanine(527)-N(7))-methyltransferase GidB